MQSTRRRKFEIGGSKTDSRRMVCPIFVPTVRSRRCTRAACWALIVAFRLASPAELAGSHSSFARVAKCRSTGIRGSLASRVSLLRPGMWYVVLTSVNTIITR